MCGCLLIGIQRLLPEKWDLYWERPLTFHSSSDIRRQRNYRRHSFEHYMLFAIDASEHRKEPRPDKPLADWSTTRKF